MVHLDEIKFDGIVLHKIGSKATDEGITFSKAPLRTSEEVNELLLHYFFSPFKSREYYHLAHDNDINLNEIYSYASAIFADKSALYEQSMNIAKHLYRNSSHPNIKSGELYVVYFRDCIIEGEMIDAIGIFKSENKDTFLRVRLGGEGEFGIDSENGININKLDKGCLIFNSMADSGYLVLAVDNLSKSAEAAYWLNDFLHLTRRKDEYYSTEEAMQICNEFVTKRMPEEFEDVCRADQAEMLNESAKFFKENDVFALDEFERDVFKSPEVIDSFHAFKDKYESDRGTKLNTNFEIAGDAVRKKNRLLKSVIKLDKNFQINVLGNSELISKGFDREKGMHYYTLFYNEEF
ncbi:MAG: nucleoid-associated protein [Candidatus Kapabacteria bacterium]|nr:nucleoid-associated protein [Candidatus Kapabacteria bacterium]